MWRCLLLGTVFSQMADFSNTEFWRYAGFYDARFKGDARFTHASFKGSADFRSVVFAGDADFQVATFAGPDRPRDATSGYSLGPTRYATHFSGSRFLGVARFSGAAFYVGTYFRGASFGGAVELNGTASHGHLGIDWSQVHGRVTCTAPVYMRFIRAFRENGDSASEKACDYDFRCFRMRADGSWLSAAFKRPGDWLAWITCGFGYKPERPIAVGVLIILAFAFGFYNRNAAKRRDMDEEAADGSPLRFRDALYFSINTFTTVGYGDWEPRDRPFGKSPSEAGIRFAGVRCSRFRAIWWKLSVPIRWVAQLLVQRLSGRVLAVVEGALGWLVLALFVATLTKMWL